MNNVAAVTMIDGQLTIISEGSSSNATLARLVQSQAHADVRNRICQTYNYLVAERRRLQLVDKADNNTGSESLAKQMPVKPEMLLSLIQFTMNQICWATRRLITTLVREQQEFESGESAENMDWSADGCEEAGVEPMNFDAMHAQVEDDYSSLNAVQNWLTAPKRIDYLDDVESLRLFANSEKNDETGYWEIVSDAYTFVDALDLMNELVVALPEKEIGKNAESANDTDFDSDFRCEPVITPKARPEREEQTEIARLLKEQLADQKTG